MKKDFNWLAVLILICFILGLIVLFLMGAWVVQQVLDWALGGVRW